MKHFYTKLLFLFLLSFFGLQSGFGQNHFVESFESPSTSWSSYFTGNVTFPSGVWDFTAVFDENSTDSFDGSNACRINDDVTNANITTPSVNGVGTVSFYYHRPFSGTGTFQLQKSVNGGSWTTLDDVNFDSVTSPTFYSYDVNDSSNNIRIRILNDNNSAHLTIDLFSMGQFSVSCSGQPTAQATNINFSNQTDTTIDVGWTAGTGGDNYILVVSEGSAINFSPTYDVNYTADTGSGDFSTAVDQGSGNKVVYDGNGTSTTVSGLSPNTTYYFQVFHYCENSGMENYIATAGTGNDGSQNTDTTYCISEGNTSFETGITLVNFNTLNNADGPTKDVGYELFPNSGNTTTTIEQNSSYNLTVNVNTDGAWTVHALAWVDWNQDGDFDEINEEYDLGDATNVGDGSTNLSPLSITVPSGAAIGDTRMRVVARYDQNPTACETPAFDGEVEDYTIEVIANVTPDITIANNNQPVAASVNQLTQDHILSTVSAAVTSSNATLDIFEIDINGTFDNDDVDNFQLFYSTTNSFGSASQIGNDITGDGNGTSQSLNFSGLNQAISIGDTAYLWVVADVNSLATAGHTLTAQPPTLTFASANITNNSTAAGTQTIQTAVPSITLGDNGTQISAGNLPQNTDDHVLSSFQIAVTNNNAELNQVDIFYTRSGTGDFGSDISLWYSTDNSFDNNSDFHLSDFSGTSVIGSTVEGTFDSFSQTININSTGYFFITIDSDCRATINSTIEVSAIDNTDLTFVSAVNGSGSVTAAGTQTITATAPATILGLNAIPGDSEVQLSWTNPISATNCATQVMVIARDVANNFTPTLNDLAYTAYSGYAQGGSTEVATGHYVVYRCFGNSITVANLTNGTNYGFDVYTLKDGNNWSSAVSANATPSTTSNTIDFDNDGNWTAGSGSINSYQNNHQYSDANWVFTTTSSLESLRNTTNLQDGFAGALGTYSWRLRDSGTGSWEATYTSAIGAGENFTQFGFSARRWDNSPNPDYTVEYSVDGGTNWTTANNIGTSGILDNTAFGNSSDWVTFSQTISSPAGLSANQFIVRVSRSGGERIFIDDFTYSIDSPTSSSYTYNCGWYPSDPAANSTSSDDILIQSGLAEISGTLEGNDLNINSSNGHLGGVQLTLVPTSSSPMAILNIAGDINSNSNIIFRSNSHGTAQLDEFTGTISGTGDVTVERYIPAKRAYRLLTSPVTTTDFLFENWQENGTAPSLPDGRGIQITGGGSPFDSSLGFDESGTNNPSMFTFDNTGSDNDGVQTNDWQELQNTNNTRLNAGEPYLTFVRGDRSTDLFDSSLATPSETVLRATGDLQTGSVTYDAAAGTVANYLKLSTTDDFYSLVANPYQAVVDFSATSRTGLTDFIYVWDAKIAGDNGNGGYVTVKVSTGEIEPPSPSSSDASEFIAPGLSFFVENDSDINTTSEIIFEETVKATGQNQVDVFNTYPHFFINSRLYTTAGLQDGDTENDAIGLRFSSNYTTPGNSNEDSSKLFNPRENYAVINNGLRSLDYQDIPQIGHKIDFSITNYQDTNYSLTFVMENKPIGLGVFILDNYLNTQTELTDTFVYNFTVDTNAPESIAEDRFSLVFDNTTLGIDENIFGSNFSLYPNPSTNGQFSISTPNLSGDVKVEITSLLGQNVYSHKLPVVGNQIDVNAQNLSSGIYVVKLTQENQSYSNKLIVE